jgi:hypothetical protein
MQRKKSVSKLELEDAKKSSKYVLTHQQQDDEGEMITSLIKGDIMRSPAGGASVIFTGNQQLSLRIQPDILSLSYFVLCRRRNAICEITGRT